MNSEHNSAERFKEVQYFWQQPLAWLVWVVAAIVLIGLRRADLIEESFALIATVFVLAIMLLVFFTKLTTQVTSEGISYRMWPFHKKPRLILWSKIELYSVKKYKPFREYGGWGVRVGNHGKAFTIKGNIGLHIKLITGQNILIGTQNPSDLEDVLGALDRNS